MSRKKLPHEKRVLEEFAFDLTPDVTGGGVSWMHHRPTGEATAPEQVQKGRKAAAPDDVEPGPTVEGHDFRIS